MPEIDRRKAIFRALCNDKSQDDMGYPTCLLLQNSMIIVKSKFSFSRRLQKICHHHGSCDNKILASIEFYNYNYYLSNLKDEISKALSLLRLRHMQER